MENRQTGTVIAYDSVAGQGIILPDNGQGELFLDVYGLLPGFELKIREGARVAFRVLAHTTGPRAEDVEVLDN